MKAYNLKIIVTILAFLLGIVCVWSMGGFSYITHLSKQKSSIVQTVPEVSISPLTSISLETEKTFIKRELNFEDYPVFQIYKGKTAKFKLPKDEYIDKDWFQYVFENSEVNFAGHYILSNKSCGMWCSIVNIIDAKTGKFYGVNVSPEVCLPHLDNEFDCSEGFSNIDYRIDSNLLVLFGFKYTNNNYDEREKGFHYYKFENGKFKHLKSVLVKDQRSARQVKLDEIEEENGSNEKLDCNKPNEYKFVVVENPNREKEGDPVVPKDLNIVIGKKIVAKIELPITDSEAKNFSLNSVEKDKEGFEIKVNWGGGNYQHEIQYNFKCKENSFYLYKVKKEFFYTKNPDSGNFLDGRETKINEIKPNLPIENFVMINYLQ